MLLCTCMSLVAIAKPVYLNPYCASAARLMEHGIGIRDAALPAPLSGARVRANITDLYSMQA